MYSLYIDTHDKKVTIIIFKDSKVLTIKEDETNNKHSTIALLMVKESIEASGITVKDLNEIIVVNGPGSFTGERIAVTIAKTMAYSLNIPIKAIDYLTILAINDNRDNKYVVIPDRNGAFVGVFDKNNKSIENYKYLNKSEYEEFKEKYEVITDLDIDYNKVYEYIKNIEPLRVHEVKPLYVKGISALK